MNLTEEQIQELQKSIDSMGMLGQGVREQINALDETVQDMEEGAVTVEQLKNKIISTNSILDDINIALGGLYDAQKMLFEALTGKTLKPVVKNQPKEVPTTPVKDEEEDKFSPMSVLMDGIMGFLKSPLLSTYLVSGVIYILGEYVFTDEMNDAIKGFVSGLLGVDFKTLETTWQIFTTVVEGATAALAAFLAFKAASGIVGLFGGRMRFGSRAAWIAAIAAAGVTVADDVANMIFGDDAEDGTGVQPEAAPSGTPLEPPPDTTGTDQVGLSGGGAINYANTGANRNQALMPDLEAILQAAAFEIGANVTVVSGGQRSYASMPPGTRRNENRSIDPNKPSNHWITPDGITWRVGSTRHDNGGAGDITLQDVETGANLSASRDSARVTRFLEMARALGATGIGLGEDYMGDETFHVGYGSTATWGGSRLLGSVNNVQAGSMSVADTSYGQAQAAAVAAAPAPAAPSQPTAPLASAAPTATPDVTSSVAPSIAPAGDSTTQVASLNGAVEQGMGPTTVGAPMGGPQQVAFNVQQGSVQINNLNQTILETGRGAIINPIRFA